MINVFDTNVPAGGSSTLDGSQLVLAKESEQSVICLQSHSMYNLVWVDYCLVQLWHICSAAASLLHTQHVSCCFSVSRLGHWSSCLSPIELNGIMAQKHMYGLQDSTEH